MFCGDTGDHAQENKSQATHDGTAANGGHERGSRVAARPESPARHLNTPRPTTSPPTHQPTNLPNHGHITPLGIIGMRISLFCTFLLFASFKLLLFLFTTFVQQYICYYDNIYFG